VTAPRTVVVLPRPNPGPDPLPKPELSPWWLLVLIPAAVIMVAIWRWRRARRRRKKANTEVLGAEVAAIPATAERELLTLGLAMRQELIDRLGQAWRAKTTEELSVSVELAEVLGAENLADFVTFLDRVDQIKFAWVRTDQQPAFELELEEWQPRIIALRDRMSKYKPKPNGREDRGLKAKRVGQSSSDGDVVETSRREKRIPKTSVL
jgi:hypothetical protein